MPRVAIVGATGAVGQEFAAVLNERRFPCERVRLFASERSAGRRMPWGTDELEVEVLRPDVFGDCQIALFSAGGSISREFAPHAVQAGAVVVDNSSAFRMEPQVPLVVPEVNAEATRQHAGIIANPNCSTIIMAVPLWALHKHNPVRRVVVSTYQAASGAGAQALVELEEQTRAVLAGQPAEPRVFPVPCAFNVFSHNSKVGDDGYNVEETKMIQETRKIFGTPELQVAVTCMRVPVMRTHLESLTVEFGDPIEPEQARQWLAEAPGIAVLDEPATNGFPTSLAAAHRDEILVGRVRRDPSVPDGRGLQFICAGDQLRKGAALNAVQIAELLLQ